MKPLTKKYIFERKLDGKPIMLFVDEGLGRWATREDAKLLQTFGIIVPHHLHHLISTHDIITYSLPFDPHNEPVAKMRKGSPLGPPY